MTNVTFRMSKHLKSSSVRCSLTVICWTPLHSSLNLRSHFCFNKKCESFKIRLINGWLIVNKTWLLGIRLQRVRALVRDLPPTLVCWLHTKSHMPLWRNGLAQIATNDKVGGSNPSKGTMNLWYIGINYFSIRLLRRGLRKNQVNGT